MATNPTTQDNTSPKMMKRFGAGILGVAIVGTSLLVGTGSAGAIVNGTDAGTTPWQVSLQNDEGHFCGGSIIDANTIVTAAHCLEGETAGGMTIRAGVTEADDDSGQDRPVASFTNHPRYAEDELGDIAIVKLAEPLNLGGNVQAIAPATIADISQATNASVTGWGAVSENGDDSNTLLKAIVPLVGDASCNAQLGTDAKTEVCAGGTGTDTCYGDSGGPLVVETPNGPRLAGITSWGDECGGETPGVYAEVPAFADFLKAGQADELEQTEFDPADLEDDEDDDENFDVEALSDDELDAMSDEEFYDYVDSLSDDEYDALFGDFDEDDFDEGDLDEDDIDQDESPSNFDLDALDELSDDEYFDYVDSLSDEEYDALMDAYDAQLDDVDSDWYDLDLDLDEVDDVDLDDLTFDWDDEDVADFDCEELENA